MLVRAAGETWREPQQVGYLSEADMQTMLAEQPSLIPGVGPHALAARELHTGVGPSDVVVVDVDGAVTVVECKLASNVEVRRKIVGQVLDYAARLWRMPLSDFESRWKACSGGAGVLDELDEQATNALTTALEEGIFRLVLAVDAINDDLRNIVEFLNAHTNEQVSVIAVELRRVSHAGVDILTPRTFGEELVRAKQDKAKRTSRETWTIEDVRARLHETDAGMRDIFDSLHAALIELGCTAHGTAASSPSMIFRLQTSDGKVSWPYAVYTYGNPVVQINFQWLPQDRPVARERFLRVLSQSPTALDPGPVEESNYKKRPSIPLARLVTPEAQQQFAEAVAVLREGS